MFCSKCGTEVDNDAQFCPECGQMLASIDKSNGTLDKESVSGINLIVKGIKTSTKELIANKKTRYITIGVVVGILILLIVLVIPKGSGRKRNYEDVANAYIDSMLIDCNAEEYISLFHEDYINVLIDDAKVDSKADLIKRLDDSFLSLKTIIKLGCGDDYIVTREITNVKTYSRSDIRDELYELEDEINIHFTSDDITDMKCVTIKYNVEGSKDKNGDSVKLVIAEIEKNWYIIDIKSGSFGF